MGVNAWARFDRDALSLSHADTVILMRGINDIGWLGSGLAPHEMAPSADDIIDGYKQLIARARVHGMRIIVATLTPSKVCSLRTTITRIVAEAPSRQPVDP